MIWVDWAIIVVFLISAGFGLIRGMVREAVSLATWVAVILFGRMMAPQVSEILLPYVEQDSVRLFIAFACIGILVMMLGSVVSKIANKVVSATGLGGFNRLLGLIFGALRGVAILVIVIAIASLTSLTQEPWWAGSEFIPVLEDLRDQAAQLVENQLDKRA